MSRCRLLLLCVGLLPLWCEPSCGQEGAAHPDYFEKNIRPVLIKHCYKCHSADSEQIGGGLLLDTREGIRAGGDTGPAVVPGQTAESLLLEALRYESYEMPPAGPLPKATIDQFEAWIAGGAVDPRDGVAGKARAEIDIAAGRRFWAFVPPTEPDRASVSAATAAPTAIDGWINTRLRESELQPQSQADRRTLIRRVTFDLTGLPPAPQDVESFVSDPRPDAFDRLVDRLLASPHHGEHRARLWLDLARYAEDQAHIVGNNKALFYPNAWRYRDWLIAALNADMPFDEFIRRQLAADLIEDVDEKELAALGFMGLGPKYYRRGAPEVMADEWEDRVDILCRGLLGLTVACARCHDHKYDPIPTEDYYGLAGVFASTEMFNRPVNAKKPTDKKGAAKDPGDSLHIIRDAKPTDLPVYIRGDVTNKGPVVERHFPQVLSPRPIPLTEGSGRLALAEAIVDQTNPLTARVFVNRVWGALLGRPLVGSPSNFGALGEQPSHPRLLDDLAFEFMRQSWSIKQLQRRIISSQAYQRSSTADSYSMEIDPDNRLLWRMNRRRLPVESWRDSLLTVTGTLDDSIGGPSIDPQDIKSRRRTVYSSVSRFDLNPMLALFDFPDPNTHSAGRSLTITPLQKLFVLNSPVINARSEELARRTHGGDSERIDRLYRLLFGREPTTAERTLGLEFLAGEDDERAWQRYVHVLVASNEAQYID